MSFLSPWMLLALPLASLPIIIHLINQRRYQTTQWAAMMFLLSANRMNRGYARIRQWAILIFRTLVIAALIFAVGRPLSSGLLGNAVLGGGSSNPIVLLDRSPSMQARGGSASGQSKLEMGVASLASTLEMLNAKRVVVIESNAGTPITLESPGELLELPQSGPSDASADLPGMMLAAMDYIEANKLGQSDVWICSDLKRNDWQATDGRWASVRESFGTLGRRVQFRLLAMPDPLAIDNGTSGNRSVRVEDVQIADDQDSPRVSMTIRLAGDGDPSTAWQPVPVTVEIDGARSTVEVNFDGAQGELAGHQIPIAAGKKQGWGKVSIPADGQSSDNDFYFSFATQPPRRTVIVSPEIVSPDDRAGDALKLAAEIPTDDRIENTAEIIAVDAVAAVDWPAVSLVLWQAPVDDESSRLLKAFVNRGGSLVFLPPRGGNCKLPFGIAWDDWVKPDQPQSVTSWRGESDLLSASLAGMALPVGQLKINRFAKLTGDVSSLATLDDGSPLLSRVPTPRGSVYALATTPNRTDSSLATNGVVLYVMIQRAIQSGSDAIQGNTQIDAGTSQAIETANGQWIAGRPDRLSTERAFNAGVYQVEDRAVAINRRAGEDRPDKLSDSQVNDLFQGLIMKRIDQISSAGDPIVSEVWRAFLILMLVAMIGEAVLCLPRRPDPSVAQASAPAKSVGGSITGAAA